MDAHTPMISVSNGHPTQNTPRVKGGQEERQEYLQCKARAPSTGAKRKDRCIYIENSTIKVKPFIVKEVGTVDELLDEVFAVIPELNNPVMGLQISNARVGVMNRLFFDNELPEDVFFLYITLYLKKHPPISVDKN